MRKVISKSPTSGPAGTPRADLHIVLITLASLPGLVYALGGSASRVMLITMAAPVCALLVWQGVRLRRTATVTSDLALKERHFRSLVHASGDLIMIVAPNGSIRYVNPAAEAVYGRAPEEMAGSTLATYVHPDDLGRVVHEVRRFLASRQEDEPTTRMQFRARSGTGEWITLESTVTHYQDGLLLNSRDVTAQELLAAQWKYDAEHDSLTGLPNRSRFTEDIAKAAGAFNRTNPHTVLLFIAFDDFSAVNKKIGRSVDDVLLVQIANRLRDFAQHGDRVAYLGSNEFAVLAQISGDHQERERYLFRLASRASTALSQPYAIDGKSVQIAAHAGVSLLAPNLDPSDLLRNAAMAARRAPTAGMERTELHAPQKAASTTSRDAVADRLSAALGEAENILFHQPVVSLDTGQVTAVSALPRWRSPQGIVFTPAEFLNIDGDRRRAIELEQWMLKEAIRQGAERSRSGVNVPVSIPIKMRRLLDGSVIESLEKSLRQYDLPPDSLIVELEHSNPQVAQGELSRKLADLRALGVRIFVNGHPSDIAATLASPNLPVDMIGLNHTLIRDITHSERQHKIASGLLRITNDLGLKSLADGVDQPSQIVALREMGCTHGRGAAFYKNLDEARLNQVLASGYLPVPPVSSGSATSRGRGRGSAYDDAAAAAKAATDFERALARIFVHLGPPPEPMRLMYTPVGSGDGGAGNEQ
ncbi:EAL domain-containing protein [Streptomyces rubiginosohelvolus]|uniref:EAL domain-containing protein n=1 Tax=Streptomyces rubiginosohelvolus TaxID=67362 RepID=UPI00380444F9